MSFLLSFMSATFMDALVGQWWAHSLGLGYLLPADHIKSSLQFAFKRNFVKSFDPGRRVSSVCFVTVWIFLFFFY